MKTPAWVRYRRRKLSAQLNNLIGWVEERHYERKKGRAELSKEVQRCTEAIAWQEKEILDQFYPLLGRKKAKAKRTAAGLRLP